MPPSSADASGAGSSAGADAPLSLGSPLLLRCGHALPNRVVKSPLSECLADPATNLPLGEGMANLYGRWARGGAGALITGNVMVDRRFMESPANVALEARDEAPERLAHYERWARAVHENSAGGNCKAIMQISHSGRQCPLAVNPRPIAPSAVKLAVPGVPSWASPVGTPREMNLEDIEEVVQRFATTARLAVKAGFDGVQVHGAHGYLLSSFLSARFNRRTDEYGGTPENRSRLLLRVLAAVRAAIGPRAILCLKLNSADFQSGGFTESESQALLLDLAADEQAKLDFVEVSGGTYEHTVFVKDKAARERDWEEDQRVADGGQTHGSDVVGSTQSQPPEAAATVSAPGGAPVRESTLRREAYFLSFCLKARTALRAAKLRLPLMLSGGWRSGLAMARAIRDDEVDIVGLGRPLCVVPDFPRMLLESPLLDPSQLDLAKTDAITLPVYSLSFRSLAGVTLPASLSKTAEAALENFAHQAQMHRMARGQEPDIASSCTTGAMTYFLSVGFFRQYLWEPRRKPRQSAAIALALGAGAATALAYLLAGPQRLRGLTDQLLAAGSQARQRMHTLAAGGAVA